MTLICLGIGTTHLALLLSLLPERPCHTVTLAYHIVGLECDGLVEVVHFEAEAEQHAQVNIGHAEILRCWYGCLRRRVGGEKETDHRALQVDELRRWRCGLVMLRCLQGYENLKDKKRVLAWAFLQFVDSRLGFGKRPGRENGTRIYFIARV